MGKGDMKTKRGKRIRGSYGKVRPRQPLSVVQQTKEHLVHEQLMEEKKRLRRLLKKKKRPRKRRRKNRLKRNKEHLFK